MARVVVGMDDVVVVCDGVDGVARVDVGIAFVRSCCVVGGVDVTIVVSGVVGDVTNVDIVVVIVVVVDRYGGVS